MTIPEFLASPEDQARNAQVKRQTRALVVISRASAVGAVVGVLGLTAGLVYGSLNIASSASDPASGWPPVVRELPTPKIVDQYPILQPCVSSDEDMCWRPANGTVVFDDMTYTLDDGQPALEPCATEDQVTDCYWDAGVRGTSGRSFQVRGGFVFYTDGESHAVEDE